jgi:hypothetical protein
VLPPHTERVWHFLREQPSLAGFILVGGSGLALRIGHRLSEDLDLAYPEVRPPCDRFEIELAAQAGSPKRPPAELPGTSPS